MQPALLCSTHFLQQITEVKRAKKLQGSFKEWSSSKATHHTTMVDKNRKGQNVQEKDWEVCMYAGFRTIGESVIKKQIHQHQIWN